ncbi:MAG: HAMP domain-containing histidine kinase [Gammaproteobacteria bacterium]|nr:HAMP domain-containing histidine kinase [Gammaproteobacteria bacterium]
MPDTSKCFNLINGVTHDLKSPLHAMLGFTDLVKSDLEQLSVSGLPEKTLSHLKLVTEIGHDMLELINNMLTAARIQSGQMAITPVMLTQDIISARLDELEQTFIAEAQSRNITFSVNYARLPELAQWDVKSLRYFVMNNLISNALKFVEKDGTVAVHLDTDDNDRVHITVADNGPGIPLNERQNIFQQFTQGKTSLRSAHGSGYGLFNACQMIKTHHGQINITEGIGGLGVCFTVSLPAMPFQNEPLQK